MQRVLAKLKLVHYSWFGLAALWLVGYSAVTYNATHEAPSHWDVSVGYAVYDHSAETRGIICFFAYVVGGFILGVLHNKYTAKFSKASYTLEKKGDGAVFTITPAKRHLPFWLFGLFGGVFMLSVPFMLVDNGFGTFATLACGVTFILIGLHPKLWRPLPQQSFEVTPLQITGAGKTVAMKDIKGIFIGNFIRDHDKAPQQQHYYTPPQNIIIYGTPKQIMVAQGMAVASQSALDAGLAAGDGIAAIAKSYAREMRARSYQIEVAGSGKNLILAKGLDLATAQAVMTEIERIAEAEGKAAAA